MANQIFYNPEGYIEIRLVGAQSYMSFMDLKAEADTLLEKLHQAGHKQLLLIDLSQQSEFSPGSNRAGMEALEATTYDGVAIFGAGNKNLAEVTQAIILAMGKTTNTKQFPDRQAAVAWLLNLLN